MSLLLVLAISRKELYILNRACYEFIFLCIQPVNLPERETSLHISFGGRIIATGSIVDHTNRRTAHRRLLHSLVPIHNRHLLSRRSDVPDQVG